MGRRISSNEEHGEDHPPQNFLALIARITVGYQLVFFTITTLFRFYKVTYFADHPWLQNIKKSLDVPLGESVRARLQQFSIMNKFKKMAHRVVAEHLSMEEVAEIKKMFEMMDVNNNWKITLEELKHGRQKIGYQLLDPDMKLLMDAADVDGNGTLYLGEFVSLSDDLGPNFEEVIHAIIRDVDANKDAKISYDEFASMMKVGTDWRIWKSGETIKNLQINYGAKNHQLKKVVKQPTVMNPHL
ncbi:hypothetical protein J5N97_017503 [Dioscorea zingiberensis]|uniref:EF-hand domain-containing protein n=1 Tax=Dioscorea zingiberensis TaxID=325984 RepID=A0A9D5CLC4_9LILI|nr:hypothetical protein J5N97_017503 [Dioscorea zingiberensis]